MSVNAVNSVNVPTANGPAAPPKSKVFDRLVSPLFQTDGFIGQAKVGALNGAMVGAGAMGAMGAFFSTKRANIGKATV
ncbi:MAG: hypothetical protein H7338_15435, partial [Candidatus Sericytochromatia bacterium]|nr:hypothetical protein [Candidatus Sericytochromatia bacterium]